VNYVMIDSSQIRATLLCVKEEGFQFYMSPESYIIINDSENMNRILLYALIVSLVVNVKRSDKSPSTKSGSY
jgi:hypothetical protein